MFSEVSGVSKALVTLITDLLFDLHMKLFDMILDCILPLEQFATLVARNGRCCVRNHVGCEIPLTTKSKAAKIASEGSVSMNLFHVGFEYLHMLQRLAADLTLDLLAVSRHHHLMSVPKMSFE